ncbi:hypothetical protein [Homoserinibacter sp. YIM 151385]|uniref:hypothetical protein n=1 Tax=Homoserinibacter sp. YIM 151385 TaxID=2985506 RepID=UPI0022F05815|nr:hypothetical protein [Homoserinibacter sp. YIM 151385]WBU38526.1 hypothetical protein OF852_02770 [Homoserinibacter sp. YIM 151385]
MIFEYILTVAQNLIVAFLKLFPEWTPPAWLTDLGGNLNSALNMLTGLAAWFDWALLTACTGAVFLAWAVFFGIKLARVGVSHVPGVGGSG